MSEDPDIPTVSGEVLPSDPEFIPALDMYNQPKVTAAEIYEALVASEGNVTAAGRALRLSRHKLQERIDRNPQLLQLMDDLREEVIDIAESNQFARAKSGADPNAERFVLQTLGRKRGYSTSVAGMNQGGEIVVQIRKLGSGA